MGIDLKLFPYLNEQDLDKLFSEPQELGTHVLFRQRLKEYRQYIVSLKMSKHVYKLRAYRIYSINF